MSEVTAVKKTEIIVYSCLICSLLPFHLEFRQRSKLDIDENVRISLCEGFSQAATHTYYTIVQEDRRTQSDLVLNENVLVH